MNHPPQGSLDHGKVVLLGGLLDDAERLEGALAEVSLSIYLAGAGSIGETARVGHEILGLDLAGEETTGDGVVDDNVETVSFARNKELRLDRSCDAVVHALVDGRSNPTIVLASHDYLGDLVRGEVANAESHKLAGLVELVDGFECLCKRDATVRAVQVEKLFRVSIR